jgi:AcrR family transcriptional regulator
VKGRPKRRELTPKKRPSQDRSRASFDAIVEACTGLLPRLGYAGTTTNHIAARAGVNIASLYEYFPGKDAIVAQVAERLVERVLGRLAEGAPRVAAAGERRAARLWVELIHETVAREKGLIAVFLTQVPYTSQLDSIRDLGARLVGFSLELRRHSGGLVRSDLEGASLQLLINLVTSTILQIVNDPPVAVSERELLDELARRVEAWIRPELRPGASTRPRGRAPSPS